MPPLRRTPLAVRLYGAALRLCPPSFRRQYADQMRRDFIEAREDARAAPDVRARRRFAAQMTLDLARTIGEQWIRGGALLIVAAAIGCALTVLVVLTSLLQRVRVDVPAELPDAETLFVVMMISVIVVVIASGIIFTQWVASSIRRRPARRRLR